MDSRKNLELARNIEEFDLILSNFYST